MINLGHWLQFAVKGEQPQRVIYYKHCHLDYIDSVDLAGSSRFDE